VNGFVDACRREWKRIGVDDAVANEMAADLEADLAEAEADGVAPEEVLGNAVFDAPSFAASWAAARGVVTSAPTPPGSARRWVLAGGAAVSLVLVVVGVVLLGPIQRASVAVAATRHSIVVPIPGVFASPRQTIFGPGVFAHPVIDSGPLRALGLLLFLVGVIGIAVVLWSWRSRRRSARTDPPGFDDSVRMPSYL
jgi:hypothetical protein